MRVVAFLLVGALYGVLLRVWMRFVSSDPEFTWSGTGYIVGIFAVLGLMAGVVGLGRRRSWGRRLVAARVLGSVLALGCFMAAGALMFPTIVPAALGVARSDWPRWLRVTLVGAGVVVAGIVVLTMTDLGVAHRLTALVLYLILVAVETALLARILAPSLAPGSIAGLPAVVRWPLAGVPLLAILVLAAFAVGLPG